jgi:hypothetical protein
MPPIAYVDTHSFMGSIHNQDLALSLAINVIAIITMLNQRPSSWHILMVLVIHAQETSK